MLNFCKRLFVPNRFDAICFAIAIHWIVAVLCVTVLPPFLQNGSTNLVVILGYVAAATCLAIAATIGWKSNSRLRMALLLISSAASIAFVVAWYCFYPDLLKPETTSLLLGDSFQQPIGTFGFLRATLLMLLFVVGAAFVVLLVNRFARWAISRLRGQSSEASNRSDGDRLKLLLGIAAILFVVAIVGRISPALGVVPNGQSVGRFAGTLMAFLAGVILWAVVLFWFPRSFALRGMPVQKTASMLLLSLLLIPVPSYVISNADDVGSYVLIVSGFLFVLSVIGIGGAARHKPQSEASDPKRIARAAVFPSLISYVAAILLVSLLSLPWFLDLTVLNFAFDQRLTATQAYELSKESAIVKWKSGGRVAPYIDKSRGVIVWKIQFDEETPIDVASTLEGVVTDCVELCDLSPDFDLSSLKGTVKYFKLTNCEVSHSQLSVLLGSTTWGQITGDFSVIDDGTVVNAGLLNGMGFEDTKPGSIQAFFDAAKCESQMAHTIVYAKVGSEDWTAVENLAQTGQVYLYGGLADDFLPPKSQRSLSQVFLLDLANPNQAVAASKELLLNTDLRVNLLGEEAMSPDVLWKLMLLRGSASTYGVQFDFKGQDMPIDQFTKETGMAYELDDDGTIRSLMFPWGSTEPAIGDLTDLKVLSFDLGWVGGESYWGMQAPVDITHYKSLTALEELYFEKTFVPEDLSFLAKLKSLKHLQIPSVARSVTGPIGFDSCQSLESVTFFGVPDDKSYFEISRLQNLKRLVIVDVEQDPVLSPEYLEKLQAKFPNVDVKIIADSQTETLIPDSFRKYRDRVRKELREDTSWLDEILN